MKQFARGVRVLAAVGLLLATAPRPAAAIGPMAGTVRIAEMGRLVSPESCLGCARTADPVACHRTALSLAMSHDWARAIAIEENVHRERPADAEVTAVLARMYQEGTRNIQRGVNRLYDQRFVRSLVKHIRQRTTLVPHAHSRPLIPRPHRLMDFDSLFTAPLSGFANVHDYYARASSGPLLPRITVPTLVIAAASRI